MKRIWFVVALVALGALATSSLADVQNIRLSGDIRLRGYFFNGAALQPQYGDVITDGPAAAPIGYELGDPAIPVYPPGVYQDDAGNWHATGVVGEKQGCSTWFISQRTRVNIEADLEDHVLVVVTLKAEGLWGQGDEPVRSSGAGMINGDPINRRFDIGVSEAYVQLNEVFYTAATLKIGRQYLHYGRGLILSSVDQEYNFDAARLVLDLYPFTLDVVGAQLVNNQGFTTLKPGAANKGAAHMVFVNGRYEMTDSPLKNVEAYFGWIPNQNWNPAGVPPRVAPMTYNGFAMNNISPMIAGVRSDINLGDIGALWVEGAYEFGMGGDYADQHLNAFIINVGARIAPKNVQWCPSFNIGYTYASGGGKEGQNTFIPWFTYTEGYNGYLFGPYLSNIHILNVGASVKPYENTTLSVQGYYYLKDDNDGAFGGSNRNIDVGGLSSWYTDGHHRDLGFEVDAIIGYDYSKDVRLQLVYGVFAPGAAYTKDTPISCIAQEFRAEMNVKF